MNQKPVTKKSITTRAISYQLIAYGILLFLIVGDEVFDFPHTIFGFPATPINWIESLIEGMYVVSLCAFTVYMLVRLMSRIKFLEGFLPICSYCKKIRKGEEWTTLEHYMIDHSEALFSHSLCPECLQKHYGEVMQPDKSGSHDKGPRDKT